MVIELPEAHVLAEQMTQVLSGRRIVDAEIAKSPHKFVFYTGDPASYGNFMIDMMIGTILPAGSKLYMALESDFTLVLGDGGERVRWHASQSVPTIPSRHQLRLDMDDGAVLTVAVQGWGCLELLPTPTAAGQRQEILRRPCPLSESFTLAVWQQLLAGQRPSMSVKEFLVMGQRFPGLGNGCLQDILYHAGVHPRTCLQELTGVSTVRLWQAMRTVLRDMLAQGGRDTETDLFGNRGGYKNSMDRRHLGQPCQRCGHVIEGFAFMGGACYVCPVCQPGSVGHDDVE